eukprot:TRINITY_DN4838_c0_g1_i1.p1 TRINITY_DN4838_c0_g1~~TRINITY_DN4838_c0_g1_i1.p1  ORF type:complete len:378 (+),score=153.28 TRINITY_DN4838_c0_g1_i1:558-1691(+)
MQAEAETRLPRQLHPFTKDMVNPFPELKTGQVPKGKRGRYEITRKDCQVSRKEMADELQKMETERSTIGKIPGMTSTGFIDSQSEMQRMQNQQFDADVIDAFRQGREKEFELARRRKEINTTANLASVAPPPLISSAHAHHPNLLPAVDRSATDHCHSKAEPKRKPHTDDTVKRQQATSAPTNFTETWQARNEAIKDVDALQKYYEDQLAKEKAASPEKQKGTFSKFSFVGGAPRSTYTSHHDDVNAVAHAAQMARDAKAPVLHKLQETATDDDAAHVAHVLNRKANKFAGEFQTTASTTYQGAQLSADQRPPPGTTRGHVFEYINGTLQMKKANEPLRKADNWDRTTNTATINPNQYTTTKAHWERMAVAGLDYDQ